MRQEFAWTMRWPAFFLMALILGVAQVGSAESPPKEAPPGEETSTEHVTKAIERMQVVRAWKLAEFLELDESSGSRLFKILAKYDQRIVEEHQKLSRKERQIRRAVKRGKSDGEINALVDEVLSLQSSLGALKKERFLKAGATLDATRRAKLLLFLPRFEREVRKFVREQRQERRKRRKGRRGHGRDDFEF